MATTEVCKSVPPIEDVYRLMLRAEPGRGILYLHSFMETLRRIDVRRGGFAPEDIQAVEAAWGSNDADILWHGGFVVRVRGGNRFYVESYSGNGEWNGTAKVSVEKLPPGKRHPSLPGDHYQTLFGWDDAPGLEEYVKRLAA